MTKRAILFVLAFICAFIAMLAVATPQISPLSGQPVPPVQGGQRGALPGQQAPGIGLPAQPGTVQGIVVREGTSEPIPDVEITIPGIFTISPVYFEFPPEAARGRGNANTPARGQAPPVENGENREAPPQPLSAVTDSAGRFTITGVPPGSRQVRAVREGYFGPSVNGAYPAAVTANALVTSQQTTEVRLSLVPGGAISGHAIDEYGLPVSEAQVQVLRKGYRNGDSVLQPVGTTQATDDLGGFRHYGLSPGEYYLAATPRQPGGRGARGTPQEVPVRTYYPSVTDVSLAVPIMIRGGDDQASMDIRLRPAAGVKISGRVISALPEGAAPPPARGARGARGEGGERGARGGRGGQGLQRQVVAGLTLVPHDRNALQDPAFNNAGTAFLGPPNDGHFEIPNVSPGIYDLYASLPDVTGFGPAAPPGQAGQPVSMGRATVEVSRSDVDGVTIVVHRGVDLTGRVTLDGGPGPANSVRISIVPDDSGSGVRLYNQVGRFQPPVDQNGAFTIPVVPEGKYKFQVAPSLSGVVTFNPSTTRPPGDGAGPRPVSSVYVEDIRQGGASVYDNGIQIGAEAANPIEVVLRTNGGSIDGMALNVDQSPAPNAMVVLVPPQHRRQNQSLYKTVRSNAQGRFLLNDLPPGSYTLFAWSAIPAGAHLDPEFLRRYDARGVSVNVTGGLRTNSEVRLIPIDPNAR